MTEPCDKPIGLSDVIACSDYAAHRFNHVRQGIRWRCLTCEPLPPMKAFEPPALPVRNPIGRTR
jgi:hypothetical protein